MRNLRENSQFATTVSTNPPYYPCHDKFIFTDVLSASPRLQPSIRNAILLYVGNIGEYLPVAGVKIIGPCLRIDHAQDCQIEVMIEVEDRLKIDPLAGGNKMLAAYKDLSLIQNTPIPSNPHTLVFSIVNASVEKDAKKAYEEYDDVYDVEKDEWVKHDSLDTYNSEKEMNADVDKFLNDLSRRVAVIDLKVNDVSNEIMDAEELKSRFKASQLPELKKQLETKLSQIESDVKTILKRYERLNKARASEYKTADAKKLATLAKNAELSEDIVYRLLERYYYVELSHKLNEILDGGPITADSVVDLKKVFDNFLAKQKAWSGK